MEPEVGNPRWRRKTGKTYISASRQDINALPTANPTFLGSSNPMELWRIVPDVTGSRFLKMAAAKPEVVISQLLDKISTPFQRVTPIFGVLDINGTNLFTVRRNLIWKLRYFPYFRFGGRHLVKRFPVTSGTIHNSAIGLLDPESGELAVGSALISCLEAEIYVFLV